MNDPVSAFIIGMADWIFGWVLLLPRDLSLLAVALITALLLVVVRRWTTDQAQLQRIQADRRILSRRLREAKAAGDKSAQAGLKLLRARAGWLKFKAEGRPLLWALAPIALIATWSYARLPDLPPRAGDEITVRLVHPVSASGGLAHLVPAPEWFETEQALQTLRPETGESPRRAEAVWRVRWSETPAEGGLVFVSALGRFEHPIEGGRGRAPAREWIHDGAAGVVTRIDLEERRLFGVVPALPGLPAWLVGYLVVVLALMPVIKRVFRIV